MNHSSQKGLTLSKLEPIQRYITALPGSLHVKELVFCVSLPMSKGQGVGMCIFSKIVRFKVLPFLFPFQSSNLTNSWRYQQFKSESVNDVAADEDDHLTDAELFKLMVMSLKNQEKADILRKLADRISEMC